MTGETTIPSHGPRTLPLLHLLLTLVAAAVLFLPVVTLGDGSQPTVVDVAGGWATASLVIMGFIMLAAVTLAVTGRTVWSNLLVIDLGVLLSLAPAVLGLLVRWETPESGIGSLGAAFWLAMALMLGRIPLSVYIRSRAARVGQR
ncbi:hypothetical protein J2T57_000333 [Natronocella acetinitrilica]|uniref:Uncharacterized protein n=1 Tax=Natronocella acetinitrilica TaxID=414046 RepID=A0AAE3G1Z4_9GAMM|nr:hypothetical protein [Natronocella acetinitrilica]MCP1673241.1 hypothetical protein [Natronocella acetinitrilica]